MLDERPDPPKVIALENVTGLLSSNGGADYRLLHQVLRARSYKVGPMLIDARHWLPQSRPRVFVVAVHEDVDTADFEEFGPSWLHPQSVTQAISSQEGSVFWSMPFPNERPKTLSEIIDWKAPVFDQAKTERLLSIIAPSHLARLESIPKSQRAVFPGYRRTRNGKQVLELRFDNIFRLPPHRRRRKQPPIPHPPRERKLERPPHHHPRGSPPDGSTRFLQAFRQLQRNLLHHGRCRRRSRSQTPRGTPACSPCQTLPIPAKRTRKEPAKIRLSA